MSKTSLEIVFQDNIKRFSDRSLKCKGGCVAIVAGTFFLSWVMPAAITFLIVGTLALWDAYSLGLERDNVQAHDILLNGTVNVVSAKDVLLRGNKLRIQSTVSALKSVTIWAFYGPVIIIAVICILSLKPVPEKTTVQSSQGKERMLPRGQTFVPAAL